MTTPAPVRNLTGKAALYVRGVAEFLLDCDEQNKNKIPLRTVQDAGLAFVVSKGDTVSVPYISQLTGRMERSGFFEKQRAGKSFKVILSDEGLDAMGELIDSGFGADEAPSEVSVQDLRDRNAILNHLKDHQGVVIHHDAPISKAAYKVLWDRFNKGQLVMAFIDPDTDQGVLEDFPTFTE